MKKIIVLYILLITYTSMSAQVQLVSSGLTSGGGANANTQSFDFSFGQVISFPIDTESQKGNVGVLQVIPDMSINTTSEILNDLKIFPNPTMESLNIDLSCEGNYNIKLSHIDGVIIQNHKSISCLFNMDMKYLASGLYIITISEKDKHKSFKINKL